MLYREITLNNNPTYAIGDIHGCANELQVLLEELVKKSSSNDTFIFVGDYINRGSQSKQVIDSLIEFKKSRSNTYFLKGNHEAVLLDYLGFTSRKKDFFLKMGGGKTLESYGAKDDSSFERRREYFPENHISFLQNLESYIISEEYVFVHAGLAPLEDLYEQTEDQLLWIRDEFINNIHRFNKTVIFGHTSFKEVFQHLPYKIGIDTGLAYGNKLTSIELVSRQVFQVQASGNRIIKK